jgi:hypothetical protein
MELISNGSVFVHFLVMSNELATPKILFCPEEPGPRRISAATFGFYAGAIPFTNDNQLSCFVGVDAKETLPDSIFCGDRNLAVNGNPLHTGLHQVWTNSTVTWVKPWLRPKPRHENGGYVCLADGSVRDVSNSGFPALLRQTGLATNRLAIP